MWSGAMAHMWRSKDNLKVLCDEGPPVYYQNQVLRAYRQVP